MPVSHPTKTQILTAKSAVQISRKLLRSSIRLMYPGIVLLKTDRKSGTIIPATFKAATH